MKKRLRFQMPHVPLKVLRGQQDEEDVQDENYTVPPGTSTKEEEAERAAADDSTSHSSHEDTTTDVDTTGSINQEAADVIQMHHLPNRDVTSNDSLSNEHRAPLLNDEHSL